MFVLVVGGDTPAGLFYRTDALYFIDRPLPRSIRLGRVLCPLIGRQIFPSSKVHEKYFVNLQRPLCKDKYSFINDSKIVPRGKGEKEPREGNEIEHETVYSQAVE